MINWVHRKLLSLISKSLRFRTDFDRIFFQREYHTLALDKGKNFVNLALILSITLLAIALAFGTLKILHERMMDPFINTLVIPANSTDKLQEDFADPNLQQHFHINKLTNYRVTLQYFVRFHEDRNTDGAFVYDSVLLRGRTLNISDPLYDRIVADENLLDVKVPDIHQALHSECTAIVTWQFLERLGYQNPGEVNHVILRVQDDFLTHLPILAIVRKLPDRSEFAISDRTYNIQDNTAQFVVQTSGTPDVEFYANIDDKSSIEAAITQCADDIPVNRISIDTVKVTKNSAWYAVRVNMQLPLLNTDAVHHCLKNKRNFGYIHRNTGMSCDASGVSTEISKERRDLLAMHFSDLEMISDFRDTVEGPDYRLKIDMSNIENRRNFRFVSGMTLTGVVILLVFSCLSILFYLTGMLTSHFLKVRQNLGALMAGGLENKQLISGYSRIMGVFVALNLCVSFSVVALIAIVAFTMNGDWWVRVFDYRLLVICLLLWLIAYFLSQKSVKNFLDYTPGDILNSRK